MEKKKILMMVLMGLGLYLTSAGISYGFFTFLNSKNNNQGVVSPLVAAKKKSGFKVDLTAPKTETCPLNGQKFTKAEEDIWSGRRPLLTMIENHEESRPPSGLSRADVVYEAVAESGVTRFMGVFYCGASAKELIVAPVRSSRIYFLSWAQEYGDKPLYVHVGGANNICSECPGGVKTSGTVASKVRAIEHLTSLSWRVPGGNDFDTTYDLGAPIFIRNPDRLDHEVATEHTMMVYLDKAFSEAAKRGFAAKDNKGVSWDKNFVSWKFSDESPTKEPAVSSIKFGFWEGTPKYDVEWKYDAATNTYLRFNGGISHTDLEEENAQLSAKNVVVMSVAENDVIDKEGHTFIETIDDGNALIFQNGKVIKGKWSKTSESGRTKFFDETGKEISFVRGIIWIEAVPNYSKVTY